MISRSPSHRRDFLKMLALASVPLLARTVERLIVPPSDADGPGVIVIVLDTLTAMNMSLYGYPRKTTPNIERFAGRSTVYNAHTSAANFTSSGTASLLTGTYPWTHRAFHYEGLVVTDRIDRNLFRYWGDSSFRLGYTQNSWANLLLDQFSPWLDSHLNIREFNLDKTPFYTSLLRNDPIAVHKSVDSFALELEPGLAAASNLALARKIQLYLGKKSADKKFAEEYPLGIPQTLNDLDTFFLLEDVFDGLMNVTSALPAGGLAYLHLFPPHYPYAPRKEFLEEFGDGTPPPEKPTARFRLPVTEGEVATINHSRDLYDAYIATVDEDFGRLFDFMQSEGILDRNYVVLTSDHGEIYERGVMGHTNEYLFEPLIRIPLVISSPGQASRVDVRVPTSSVDVMPTLLSLVGKNLPESGEGVLLPALGGVEDASRSIFSIDTKSSHVHGPIHNATVSIRIWPYKLISYLGYEGFEDAYELFDLENDRGETKDLASSKPETLADLRQATEEKLRQVNAPFQTRE